MEKEKEDFKDNPNEIENKNENQNEIINTNDSKIIELDSKIKKLELENNNNINEKKRLDKLLKDKNKNDLNLDTLKKEIVDLELQNQNLKDSYEDKLKDLALDSKAKEALFKAGMKSKACDILMNNIKKHCKYENNEIKFYNEDGTSLRYDFKDATIETFIDNMKKEYDFCFENQKQVTYPSSEAGNVEKDDNFRGF